MIGRVPKVWTKHGRDWFFHFMKFFVLHDLYLFNYCSYQVFKKCIPNYEILSVLSFCYDQACVRYSSGRKTVTKVLQFSFCLPILFRDAFDYCKNCPRFQQLGRISMRNMMLNPIIMVEILYVWGIDFLQPFSSFLGN